MKQYHAKHTAVLSTRGFYTILTVCGLIIAVSAWVLWTSISAPNEPPAAADTPVITPAGALPDLSEDLPAAQQEPQPAEPADAEVAEESPAPAEEQPSAPVQTVYAPVYVRPVSGAVLTPFSGDELLFQPTLGDWRVHTGTDFAAEAGETVLALTDGAVTDVFEQGLYGTCVTMTHDGGLTTTYRGLTDVRVSAGQAVSAGEAIGACAPSIEAEAALDPHIHVEAAIDGTAIDVLTLLGEYEPE
ncbi:MAG: peptidoglycan DD-metalloendopeptidase family protein [Agathobaculum sp.]|jgi:murein DD-endopeptidase MepM/ murein hydrolase activator NlpD|uniref:peptidoglycan DD-metalloendopeptidase family protein n=1 Tax=Agathobaculum sp. TaxID=2048138 RepID=UPI003D8D2CCC